MAIRESTYKLKGRGPSLEPWGTPHVMLARHTER